MFEKFCQFWYLTKQKIHRIIITEGNIIVNVKVVAGWESSLSNILDNINVNVTMRMGITHQSFLRRPRPLQQ